MLSVNTSSRCYAFVLADAVKQLHQDLRNNPRCRATFEALVGGLQRHVGWSERTSA